MRSFEQYHPIHTGTVTLDWLTKQPLKEIKTLLNSDNIANVRLDGEYDDKRTANFINGSMKQIMHNKALIWGISEHSFHGIKGIVAINHLDGDTSTFNFIFSDDFSTTEVKELFRYLVLFVFKEIKKKRISVLLNNNQYNIAKVFHNLGFKIIASSLSSSRFELTAQTV